MVKMSWGQRISYSSGELDSKAHFIQNDCLDQHSPKCFARNHGVPWWVTKVQQENWNKVLCRCVLCGLPLGPGRVDIFNRVANPSIWMYYLPDLGMNRVSFAYMYKISYGMCEWIVGCWHIYRQPSTSYRQYTSVSSVYSILNRPEWIWKEMPCL